MYRFEHNPRKNIDQYDIYDTDLCMLVGYVCIKKRGKHLSFELYPVISHNIIWNNRLYQKYITGEKITQEEKDILFEKCADKLNNYIQKNYMSYK